MRAHRVLLILGFACAFGSCATAARQPSPLRPAGEAWLFFIDDLHLDFRNTGRLRELLRIGARELIKDGDVFAVRSSGPARVAIDWTSDRQLFNTQIRQVAGNGLKPYDIVGIATSGEEPNEVRLRATISLTSASEFVKKTNVLRGRIRRLIYISNGYDLDEPGFRDRLASLARAARNARVTIFPIDLRTLPSEMLRDPVLDAAAWERHLTTTQNTLRVLAKETGGFAVLAAHDPAGTIKQISAFPR